MDYGIFTVADSGEITLGSGDTPKRVSGLSSLVQEVLIELLSDPMPERSRGAGLASIMLEAVPSEDAVVASNIASAVRAGQAHVFANQQLADNLTANDRLQSLTLVRAQRTQTGWDVTVEVTNQAGESATFSVPT